MRGLASWGLPTILAVTMTASAALPQSTSTLTPAQVKQAEEIQRQLAAHRQGKIPEQLVDRLYLFDITQAERTALERLAYRHGCLAALVLNKNERPDLPSKAERDAALYYHLGALDTAPGAAVLKEQVSGPIFYGFVVLYAEKMKWDEVKTILPKGTPAAQEAMYKRSLDISLGSCTKKIAAAKEFREDVDYAYQKVRAGAEVSLGYTIE